MRAKIGIFFIATLAILFSSCEKNETPTSSIPNIHVAFSINILNTPELQTPLQAKYVTAANGEKVGYKGHGIYIIRINNREFRAFDASCTFQSANESHPDISENLIFLKGKTSVLVQCPKCKSTFNLLDGNVQSGKARESLKEYKVAVSGNTLRVYN